MTDLIVGTMFQPVVTFVSDLLADNFPSVLLLLASLIGLVLLVRYFVLWISGRRSMPMMSSHLRELIADEDLRERRWKVPGGNEM